MSINITNGQSRKRVMEQKKKVNEVDKGAIDAAVQQALDSDMPKPMPRPKARPTKVPRPKARPTINIGSDPKTGATRGIDPRDNYSCLLYTSPSPRDGLLSRMPSSA